MTDRPLPKKNDELELTIHDMAFGGVGISKLQTEKGDFILFVQNTIPGQIVKARVTKAKKTFAECRLESIICPSPEEVPIPYQSIPGAPYATLPIDRQIELKRKTALELYRRIGKIEDIETRLDEMIISPGTWHYRNKMEYSFSAIRFDLEKQEVVDDFALGFKHRGTWWMVENLDRDSGLFDSKLETSLSNIRKWCEKTGLPAYHPPGRHGFFRFLVARKSYFSDELLINLVTSEEGLDKFDTTAFVNLMKGILGSRLAGLFHTINNDTGDRVSPLQGSSKLLCGTPKIVEVLNGLEFEISMESFFQTNPRCAEKLYDKVVEYAGENSDKEKYIFDLFCGTGTIAQLLAKGTKEKVVGVDIEESAIEDAKRNARRNKIRNVEFHAADVGKFLLKYPHYRDRISTIILDPPRAGIAPKSLDKVLALGAARIVYVSCNPATQARDAEILMKAGYQLKKISLADQFPHTSHIEAIALFEK
ncbi:MAG: 23S rRNA (uracil(1939)-C(5))-methyltransferase RlmD [Flavobacteriales bacterium]|nr:23S rRNA (uracil(1939)-C(5))-methyltransferase RlmD [Flavobacteriales bacterium]